jgi:hypothetical protein
VKDTTWRKEKREKKNGETSFNQQILSQTKQVNTGKTSAN